MKSSFEDWYADEVAMQLTEQGGIFWEHTNVDMRLSTVKPIYAKWLLQAFQKLSDDSYYHKAWLGAGGNYP